MDYGQAFDDLCPPRGATATYYPGGMLDDALEFALYGAARQNHWMNWKQLRPDLGAILELGPSTKWTQGAERLNWPEYNFDSEEHVLAHKGHTYVGTLPYDDNSCGGVIATHVLEHLSDPRPIIKEVARVLIGGCPFNIVVPHARSNVYLHDIDHKTPFILDTWDNLLNQTMYDRDDIPFEIGTNFKFAIKEGNEMLVTQLVKK